MLSQENAALAFFSEHYHGRYFIGTPAKRIRNLALNGAPFSPRETRGELK